MINEVDTEIPELTPEMDEHLTIIARARDKNERLSWKRKYDKMTTILETIVRPIEDKIAELLVEKTVAMDEINELRLIMIKECIHPKDHLIHYNKYVVCKFCNGKLKISAMNKIQKENEEKLNE